LDSVDDLEARAADADPGLSRPPEPAPSSSVHLGSRGGLSATSRTWADGRGVGAATAALSGRPAGEPRAV